ncbi:MAG TPA: MBL fold metallo-hydrolase [Candidatus Binatia bacterium]|nr:MBL fold metallo-hydrolase [Candidatus Binatia bacterium]
MKINFSAALVAAALWFIAAPLSAQDLEPQIRKITDGIYVYVGKNLNSNCGIVLTQDGVVLIDSGHNPTDSRAIAAAVKKLTPMPVRFLIDSEPHPDHTTGHFIFSPPATIIAAAGASESMKGRDKAEPDRNQKLAASSPEMGAAFQGYRMVLPHVEYRDRMTLNVGERIFELFYMKNVHSEADSAVWLPKERVLFSASAVVVEQFNVFRPNVNIPDILAAVKMMKALNPQFVIPGHGIPGTTKIFDDSERYYALLLERVGKMARDGKSLDEIQKTIKMPEYDGWATKERFPGNVEAAYRAVQGK